MLGGVDTGVSSVHLRGTTVRRQFDSGILLFR
jgi:hypothetical protein